MKMKLNTLFIGIIAPFFWGSAQQTGLFVLDDYQKIETSYASTTHEIQLPAEEVMAIMGGLNDWDGMNNYFNIFGSKLIVERMDVNSDGSKQFTLRREDGRDFYNLFQTITAKLIPISVENSSASPNSQIQNIQ
ncbi:hypothetical protein [Ulvibacterium marinum]|uniref:hypothetical protein n=1 Tax=Ulvibacterium marinum TaxID=2419782 RepID=UPI002494276E|nr:hypothetical protein [Ulvibacterium marinum]